VPRLNSSADLDRHRSKLLASVDAAKPCITICSGTGCHALRSDKVHQAFVDELAKCSLDGGVDILRTGCHGFCERGTIVTVLPQEVTYLQVKPDDVAEIVAKTVVRGEVIDRLLYQDSDGRGIIHEDDIPFYRHQSPFVFGLNRFIDPQNIDSYILRGGYAALAKALFQMSPERVLEEVKTADLRGRGGGGFPAGAKWQTTRDAPGDVKYVVVNADEGDPGAYMDRSLLEGNPHRVLEGLIIGAYAIGAREGFVYVRQEYPIAVENLSVALEQAREYGLLGPSVLGSGLAFDVRVHRGAGAFVSGESSALMCAIEGRVGEPRPKYVRTSVSGIWGKPTNLNNVETWATVPLIIDRGADWFTSIGTEKSKGTKIFSLVGKVNNTGLVEVPMGMTLRQVVYDIGGGVPKDRKFKAVQTGGPSGGVIPEELLDLPVDFDELAKAGSMMGSGGMIVLDEDTCMVDTARYYLAFLAEESCGKCVPCREGMGQMLKVLDRVCAGDGREGDIELLEEISEVVQGWSLCALGGSAPNPVLSTIVNFRDEYEAHILEKRCPAGVCKALISYYIDPQKCQACMLCLKNCAVGAISGGKKLVHVVDQHKCTKCGTCLDVCPSRFDAVMKVSGVPVPETVPQGTQVTRKRGGNDE
jgi:NADH:ubiquinone oxidoreductase subunit F (NADH-binding)/(2Fe-2S) ferredoxin/Pyruvate/2-oxoacid:ferredoxin oxidoreductase delta subunit